MTDEELIARLHLPWPIDGNVEEVTLPVWVLELTGEAADRIEALTEQLAAARQDAKAAEDELEMQEQEACMMENDYIKLEKERDALEAKLATCEKYRDAYAGCDRIGTQAVRDLEAKLAKAVKGLELMVLHAHGLEKQLTEDLFHQDFCGESVTLTVSRATLAEIKGESHD
jgi:chromosome segregation ATPase